MDTGKFNDFIKFLLNFQVVFLFTDLQIKDEAFMEDISMVLNTGEVPYRFPLYFKEGLEQTCFNLYMLTINTASFIWEWLTVPSSQVLEVQYFTNRRICNKCIKFPSFQNISRDARLPSDPLSSQPWHCRVSSIESFALEMINDA